MLLLRPVKVRPNNKVELACAIKSPALMAPAAYKPKVPPAMVVVPP